ncbi:MAG: hypothetical protein WC248_04790 [Candidatus Methanomethylophilaceae archaeon]
MKSLELTSLRNILTYSVITTLAWIAIISIAGMIIRGSIDIKMTLITGIVFGVILFCLTCVFSWKNLKH